MEDDFNREDVDRHYGLASTKLSPTTQGYGDTIFDDPARGAEYQEQQAGLETAVEERAKIREGTAETTDGMPEGRVAWRSWATGSRMSRKKSAREPAAA